jgi:hexulose-6-phosphate isomerase
VYPDLGNLSAWGNDTMAEIDLGRHEIVAVHIKDTLAVTPDFPGKFKCVPFGTGCVDFPACFKRLAQQDYAGPFMVEMWYDPALDWKKDITESKAMIENWFAEGTKGV